MPELVKRYFQLLWSQRSMALLGLLLAIITALAGIALLAVSGWFISATALAGLSIGLAHGFNYFAPGAIVRGLSITRTAGRYGERLSTHEATFRVISRLRSELFITLSKHNWQEQPLNNHEASSRLLEDIRNAESLYLSALVPGVVMLVCTVVYLVTLALFLPGVAVQLLPLILLSVIFLPFLYLRKVLEPQDQQHQLRSQQWQDANSLFSNLRTLILFDRLLPHQANLQSGADVADQYEQRASQAREKVLMLNQLIMALVTLLVLWNGLSAMAAGQLEGAMVFMLLLLTLGTQEVISNGCSALAGFGLGYTALERIGRLAPAQEVSDTRCFIEGQAQAIIVTNLTYCYPGRAEATLRELNAGFKTDQWNWVTSYSGSGKTTLIQLLAGQLQPQQGNIYFAGLKASDISLMPQRISLLQGSLRFNLCLHQSFSEQQLWQALQMVELDDWASGLPEGLDTLLGKGTIEPSGGELKRLGLARLILADKQVLLLDEPTAGLDAERSERILKRLREHWDSRLVVINSHEHQLMSPGDQSLNL